jgi:hypothetical protein
MARGSDSTCSPIVATALALAAVSCSRGPEPCASAGTCPDGQECLANRCVVAGGEPVASDSQRLVVEPDAMALVSARGRPEGGELPPAVTFGSGAEGASALYLRFSPVWHGKKQVEAAFLVLEPMSGTPPAQDEVSVEVWRVRERWQPEALTWLRQPARGLPKSTGIARSTPDTPLRVDVTELCRYSATHPHSEFGMVLESGSGSGVGTSYATGTSGGRGPWLEVYVR